MQCIKIYGESKHALAFLRTILYFLCFPFQYLGVGLRRNDQMLIDRSIGFQRLYKNEWRVLVSSASLRSLGDNKFNKTDMLPNILFAESTISLH